MTVRGGPGEAGEASASESGPRSKSRVIAEIVAVFDTMDEHEIVRLRDVARALHDRNSDEVVVFTSGPPDLDVTEALLPPEAMNAVWRGQISLLVGGADSVAVPKRARNESLEARNQERVRRLRQEILAESVPVSDAAASIGRTEQAAINRAVNGDVLAFRDGVKWMFPRWQFDAMQDKGVVAGLGEARRALDIPSFSAVLWFRKPAPALGGRSPIDALRDGDVAEVVSLARTVGTQ